jgi:protein SCO1/2
MIKKALPFLFLAVIVFGLTGFYLTNRRQVGRYDHLGGDFRLSHVSGDKSLKDFEGRPVILYFGFTTCPDICPLALNKLNRILDKLAMSEREKTHKVFVGVDYKRDTTEKVDEYVRYFADDFIGLAGTKKQIEEITKKYAVHFEFVPLKDSALGYTVDHTSRYFLINKKGKLLNSYSDISDPDFLQHLRNEL